MSEFDEVAVSKDTKSISKRLELEIKDNVQDDQHHSASVTDSPIESVSPSLEHEEISPLHNELIVDQMKLSLGHSPSDFHFEDSGTEGRTLEEIKKNVGFLTQESKDSLFDDEKEEPRIGQLRQFERVISTESKHEHKKTVTSTSVEQKTVSREEVDGEEPRIVMEEKVFSTEDTENYSKSTESKNEMTLTTTETITEEDQDEGADVKKEVRELVATIDENSQNKVDETTSKSLKKVEEVKETIFPYVKEVDGERKEQLVDNIHVKEEILETTLNTQTDTEKHKTDETTLTSERLLEGSSEEEKVVEGSEIQSEVHKQTVTDKEKEKITAEEKVIKNDDFTETLFEVKYEPGEKPDVEPIQERHEHQTEEVGQRKVYVSDSTVEESVSFTIDKNAETAKEAQIEKFESDIRLQRDSGLFDETFSEDSEPDEPEETKQEETMAFDNMAFTDEDVVIPKEVNKSVSVLEHVEQNRDISPEDLKEGLTRFDFAEELKEEMAQTEMLGGEDDRTLSLSGLDLTEKQVQCIATPLEAEDLPSDETEKTTTSDKISSGFISAAGFESSELQGAVGPAIPSEQHMPNEAQDHDSASSSSSEESEVFDKVTGKYVHWEIQHHYSRQFSDSFSDQSNKEIEKSDSSKSLDLGVFYRREEPDETYESNEEGTGVSSVLKSGGSSDVTTKKKGQRVRFSLSEDHTEYYDKDFEEPVHSYDIRMNEEWEKVGESENTVESALPQEPHNKITEAYQQAVIASIIESRMQIDQERKRYLEELETMEKESESSRYSSSSISSTEIEFQEVDVDDEYEDDVESNPEIMTVSQAVQTQSDSKPFSVVSKESRLAQEELLKESFDEKDRSLSPSIDSEDMSTTYDNQKELQDELDVSLLSRKHPVTVQLQGKPICAEYEHPGMCEEERLSPIEETAADDMEGAEVKVDKKVTFQTDPQQLCSVSSEDLVKTSTSSSEVEPTLLAASYDLESGRVSHVVSSYDLSPDAVEKQFLPVIQPPKTILSSPEDDVFEADITLAENNDTVIDQTPTEPDVELLPTDSSEDNDGQKLFDTASAGTSSLPSPPAPSPFETCQTVDHTASDLQDAATKMKELKYQDSVERSDSQLETVTEKTEQVKTPDSQGSMSPFEVMSPSDMAGYEDFLEKQKQFEESMFQSMTSQTSASSYEEVTFETEQKKVSTSAPIVSSPDKSVNESSFEHSSLISSETSEKSAGSSFDMPQVESLCSSLHQDTTESVSNLLIDEKLPNGPTEVEYNPEIDVDSSEQSSQNSSVEPPQPMVLETSQSFGQLSQIVSSQGSCLSYQGPVTGSAESTQPTGVTESIIEELPPHVGQDVLVVSDQTLYGLEMPSDEAASMTTSNVECESLNVSIHTSTSVHDDTSGQIDSREVFSQTVGIDRTDEDVSERPSESIQDLPTSPVTEESHDTVDVETLMEEEGSPNIPEVEHERKQSEEVEICNLGETKAEEAEKNQESPEVEASAVSATLKGYEVTLQEIDDIDLERRTPDTFLDDELDEELMQLQETPDNDIDTKLDDEVEKETAEGHDDRVPFELKADSCDLDRPLTPTPVDKNQGFFEDSFSPDDARKLDEAVAVAKESGKKTFETQDDLLEKTACVFVENVLEEVKVKVRFKAVLDVDDDVALVQSPLSENGGSMTDFADELPYDEPVGEELLTDDVNETTDLPKDRSSIIGESTIQTTFNDSLLEHINTPVCDDSTVLPSDELEQRNEEAELVTVEDENKLVEYNTQETESLDEVVTGIEKEKTIQEIIQAASNITLEGARQKSHQDYVDSGNLCRPEENDIEIEQEIGKSETDGLALAPDIIPIDSVSQMSSTETFTTRSETLREEDVIAESSNESEVQTIIQSGHFLGKSSDFSSSSVSSDKFETTFVDTSSEYVSEQALKSERLVQTCTTKTEISQSTEVKTVQKTRRSSIPITKSLSAGSADSLDDDRSGEGARSSEIDDIGDSSSVDSFTTVVAADEEEKDDDDEDRLADFASLTSSIHSDIQGGGLAEDHDDDRLEEKDPLEELMAWAQDKKVKDTFGMRQDMEEEEEEVSSDKDKDEDIYPWNKNGAHVIGIMPHPWRKDEEDNDSIGGSDRYDYIDRQALSVITELSDEDRFEIINKEELESESTGSTTGTGSDSRHYSSPDFPPPSPMSNLKFFNKSGERDDISVSSSLLEFERLENEIDHSRSSGSIETGSKDSFGGSLDESKFLSKSLEKDDISISSSLADFERLEREVAHGSSDSSIEKIFSPAVVSPPETGKSSEKSSVSGSLTSLAEFERLEREMTSDGSRKSIGSVESSVSHVSLTSISSSQASLNEFERFEQDFNIAEELEREAQKIVSILESGSLLPNQYSSEPELSYSESLCTTMEFKSSKPTNKDDDMDKDSVEGRDEIDEDSLSENKKKTADDTDSLDGDRSEMTSSITSAILKSESATKIGTEYDLDSLHDSTHSSDGAMKISSDSLGEKLGITKTEKEKFDTDSLSDQEGVIEKTSESKQESMLKSSDSLEIKESMMEKSTDSLELSEKDLEKVETDSLQDAEDTMQASVDSLESYQIVAKHNVMEVSMESAGTGWSSASSMFSRSSIDTMRSADKEEQGETAQGQSHDIMEASMESWEEYGADEEETDNFYIISKYQSSLREAAEFSKSSKTEKSEYTHPYFDYESNIAADNIQYMMSGPDWDTSSTKDADKSPYLSKQPYEEKKKIYTMTEWEAMKKAKKQQMEEEEMEKAKQKQAELSATSPTDKSDMSESTSDEPSEKSSSSMVEEKKGDSEVPMEMSTDSITVMEKTLTSSQIEGETDSFKLQSITESKTHETEHTKTEHIQIKTKKTLSTETKVKLNSKVIKGISYVV